jgi:hypothetical protein
MSDDGIAKKVLLTMGQIGAETGKEILKEGGKIGERIISGQELLGNIKPMSEEEFKSKAEEEEKRSDKEMSDLRQNIGGGRNVEGEIEEVRRQREAEEKEKEERILEEVARQREIEAMELVSLETPGNQKKSAAKMQGVKGKKSAPDLTQMSATAEFKGKVD